MMLILVTKNLMKITSPHRIDILQPFQASKVDLFFRLELLNSANLLIHGSFKYQLLLKEHDVSMNKRDIDEIVNNLKSFFTIPFGGKPDGRYQISRERLRKLSGRPFLKDTFLADLIETAFASGLVIIDIGDAFAVIESSIVTGYRNLPPAILEKAIR